MDVIDDGLAVADAPNRSAELPPWHGKRGRPTRQAVADWEAYQRGETSSPAGDKAAPPGAAIPLFGGAIPPKPRPRPKKNLEAIERSIILAHAMLAMKLETPELVLAEDEAHLLTESFATLSEYYKVKLDGKNGAIFGMVWAILMIYGPRIFTLVMRHKGKPAEAVPDALAA